MQSSALATTPMKKSRLPGSFSTIYFFSGGPDGSDPAGDLTTSASLLYGTTAGIQSCGTAFSMTPSGSQTVLHVFGVDEGDGCNPVSNLLNVNGTLYGTTLYGGSGYCGGPGCGTVFSIDPSGTYQVVYSFQGAGDGIEPFGNLVNVGGDIYGTTSKGGMYSNGTIFVISSGQERVIHSFGGPDDGAAPRAGLLDVAGVLYGTTSQGGVGKKAEGTVFSITPQGTEKVLWTFKKKGDGSTPLGGLTNIGNTLYGTTVVGGAKKQGCVFSVQLNGKKKATEAVVYSFAENANDGSEPYSDLLVSGQNLYGTTLYGGASGGYGTVFEVTQGGQETILHSFSGRTDGYGPYGGLVQLDGVLYGTTSSGGPSEDGTVFALTP